VVEVETVGLNSLATENIKVSPNPTTGVLNIQNNSKVNIESIELFNGIGQRVYLQNERLQSVELNENLHPGIYLLRINTSEGSLIKKIVLQR